MITTDDLQFFLIIAAAHSLADAARTLDVTPSAVTQRLGALERRLNIRLVLRSGRRTLLTDEGSLLAERARTICGDLAGLADELASSRGAVTGHLRVVAPLGFGHRYVAPAIAQVRRTCPEVSASLTLSDRPASLTEDRWDVLVHIGELRDSTLVMHRLAPNQRVLCAAPSYLKRRGVPAHPEDLRDHDCIALRENDEDVTLWRFGRRDGTTVSVRIEPVLASNEGGVAREWALAGMGIMVRSEWDVAAYLREGKLVSLLPDWRLPDADVVALVRSRQAQSARTAYFLDCLRHAVSAQPWLSPYKS